MNNKVRIITNTDKGKGETTFNCNPNLTHYCIPVHDPLWFDFRTVGALGYAGGIGGSECAKFMRVEAEKYSPVLPQLMEYKAGIGRHERRMTQSMLSGILAESSILQRWEYWDGTPEGYCMNYMAGDKKRLCKTVNSYIVNKKFPWLFVSLDAAINKGFHALNGLVLEEDCPLECKTIGFQAAKSYDHGLPLSYVYQLQCQMLVTECDYAELAILEGGNNFRVEYFEADLKIQQAILEKTRHYWEIILKMRELNAERDQLLIAGDHEQAEECKLEIDNMLPLPVAGEAYSEYYSDKHAPESDEGYIQGTFEDYRLVRARQQYSALAKKWEEKKEEIDNLFRHKFVTNGVNLIDFGNRGKLRYRKYKNGYSPDYKSVKEKADKKLVTDTFNNHFNSI